MEVSSCGLIHSDLDRVDDTSSRYGRTPPSLISYCWCTPLPLILFHYLVSQAPPGTPLVTSWETRKAWIDGGRANSCKEGKEGLALLARCCQGNGSTES